MHLPDNGDLKPFADIAHRIKGAARIVGAAQLIKHCEILEHASPSNLIQARNDVQASMQALEQVLARQLQKLASGT